MFDVTRLTEQWRHTSGSQPLPRLPARRPPRPQHSASPALRPQGCDSALALLQSSTQQDSYQGPCAVAAVMIDEMQRSDMLQRGCNANHRGTTARIGHPVMKTVRWRPGPFSANPFILADFATFLCRNILPWKITYLATAYKKVSTNLWLHTMAAFPCHHYRAKHKIVKAFLNPLASRFVPRAVRPHKRGASLHLNGILCILVCDHFLQWPPLRKACLHLLHPTPLRYLHTAVRLALSLLCSRSPSSLGLSWYDRHSSPSVTFVVSRWTQSSMTMLFRF